MRLSCDLPCVRSDPNESARAARCTSRGRLLATASIAAPLVIRPVGRDTAAAMVTVHVERACSACRVAVQSADEAAAERKVRSERSAHPTCVVED